MGGCYVILRYWRAKMTDPHSKKNQPEADSNQDMSQEEIDENIDESFPASDPPSWNPGQAHEPSDPKKSSESNKDS